MGKKDMLTHFWPHTPTSQTEKHPSLLVQSRVLVDRIPVSLLEIPIVVESLDRTPTLGSMNHLSSFSKKHWLNGRDSPEILLLKSHQFREKNIYRHGEIRRTLEGLRA